MRFILATLFCAVLLMPAAATSAQKKAPDKKAAKTKPAPKTPLPFKTFKENFSYGFGMYTGEQIYGIVNRSLRPGMVTIDRKKLAAAIEPGKDLADNIKKGGVDIDDKRLKEGFQAALSGAKARIDVAQMKELFDEANKQLVAHREKQGEKNKKEGEAFLKANKKKEGVKTTKSGLQYQVLKEGKGNSPKATDFVVTHYHGTRVDGKVFDSSVERKKPATFRVGGVIKGWQEALQMMKKGSKWKIVVPADLAYREEGKGDIGPNTVLIFELELLEIKAAPKFDPRRFKPRGR
jgi:FKBP-type peptidyl-prolyl cis-trans isomerase FklB